MRRSFLPSLGLLSTVLMSEATEGGEGAAGTEAPADPNAVRIRPDVSGYVKSKSASGSATKICGDATSVVLNGATLDETYAFTAKVTGVGEDVLREKYSGSNVGQQRMFLGNLIRPAMADAKSPMKDADKAARIRAAFEAALPEFRKAIDARLGEAAAAAEAEKQRKATERQKAKDDKAAAKKSEAKPAAAPKSDAPKAERPAAPKAPAQPK